MNVHFGVNNQIFIMGRRYFCTSYFLLIKSIFYIHEDDSTYPMPASSSRVKPCPSNQTNRSKRPWPAVLSMPAIQQLSASAAGT